jgi:hypothetical protein
MTREPARDPMAVVEPQAQAPLAAPSPAPERKARVLRDSEGGESHAPAFLQAPTRADTEDAPKPRRRRAPRAEGPAGEAEEA